ncbi:hypothetical protein Ancab_028880 [Ancistrocladus abbreviatus]
MKSSNKHYQYHSKPIMVQEHMYVTLVLITRIVNIFKIALTSIESMEIGYQAINTVNGSCSPDLNCSSSSLLAHSIRTQTLAGASHGVDNAIIKSSVRNTPMVDRCRGSVPLDEEKSINGTSNPLASRTPLEVGIETFHGIGDAGSLMEIEESLTVEDKFAGGNYEDRSVETHVLWRDPLSKEDDSSAVERSSGVQYPQMGPGDDCVN